MNSRRVQRAIDYNRGLPAVVRWAHLAGAILGSGWDELRQWGDHPFRRGWALPLVLGAAGVIVVLPLDPWLQRRFAAVGLRGDPRRELEALQQFGQLSFMLIIAAAFALLDPPRRRRVLDWFLAAGLAFLAAVFINGFAGRPRPLLHDPFGFAGPLGMYPLHTDIGWTLVRGWSSAYELSSFPSRHATLAAVAACFLMAVAPPLRPLALALAGIVGVARVATGAHWPSDVLAGWALGTACAWPVLRGYWGIRLVDALWIRFVDRHATPAFPRLRAACGG